MPRDSTPQDKKRKSLERDGRNCYGENDKSSRKSIRRRKEIVNRTFRRATQALSAIDTDADDLNDLVSQVERIDWKKVPDKALGDHLLDKLISQIIKRVLAASEPEGLLAVLETKLIDADVHHQTVQDISRQLHGIVRARWSTSFPLGTRSTPLKIDYNLAKTIADILGCNGHNHGMNRSGDLRGI